MTRYVFLDTETTGLHATREAWEIGMLVTDDLAEQPWADHMFIDVSLAGADVKALEIGGFYDRHPVGRLLSGVDTQDIDPEDAGRPLYDRIAAGRHIARVTHQAVLVVNNPYFDVPLLEALVREADLVPTWHYRPIDVIAMAAGYAHGLRLMGYEPIDPTPPPWHSELISRAVGVDPPEDKHRHTAIGDALWVWQLFTALLVFAGEYDQEQDDDVPGIAEDHAARRLVPVTP